MMCSPYSPHTRWPLGVILVLVALFGVSSCVLYEELEPFEGAAEEAKIVLSAESLQLELLETKQLSAVYYDASGEEVSDAQITWQTEDASIASVDQLGMVKGLATGETTLFVRVDEVSATVSVEVYSETERLEILPSKIVLFAGDEAQFEATLNDANGDPLSDITISWSTEDSAIATVDANGLLTAISNGATEVTASVGGKSASATVEVVQWAQIGAGYFYSCGVLSNGDAFCWGRNNIQGVLGNGTTDSGASNQSLNDDHNANMPSPVSGGIKFASISVGLFHNCALTSAGQAYCWGAGGAGHLGNGANEDSAVPVAVSGAYEFTDIQTGSNHSCALDISENLYCWGYNGEGQLGQGDGSSGSYFSPQRVIDHKFIALAVGTKHTCAISKAGPTYCWGQGAQGELGDGNSTSSDELVQVATAEDFVAIAGGYEHTCALNAAGEIYCWGENEYANLGDGTTTNQNSPVRADALNTYEQVFAGSSTTCGLDSNDDLYCWGFNGQGNLGNGTTAVSESSRVLVSSGRLWQGVSLGLMHTCALTRDQGEAFCWGDSEKGQVGNGEPQSFVSIPTAVSNP